jgi:hypothetical protein
MYISVDLVGLCSTSIPKRRIPVGNSTTQPRLILEMFPVVILHDSTRKNIGSVPCRKAYLAIAVCDIVRFGRRKMDDEMYKLVSRASLRLHPQLGGTQMVAGLEHADHD